MAESEREKQERKKREWERNFEENPFSKRLPGYSGIPEVRRRRKRMPPTPPRNRPIVRILRP